MLSQLNGEIFYTLREAQVLTEQWRVHYNTTRPHSSLGWLFEQAFGLFKVGGVEAFSERVVNW